MKVRFVQLTRVFVVSVICALSMAAIADDQSRETNIWGFTDADIASGTFYLEQDAWAPFNSDKNYTMGIGFGWSGKGFENRFLGGVRGWLDDKFSFVNPEGSSVTNYYSIIIGDTAFTPDDLEEKDPIFNDRPYANLVFLSNSRISAYSTNVAMKSTFVLGVLGLDIGGKFQNWWHNDVGMSDQDPNGWHNQISDGGEPTALYSLERQKLLFIEAADDNLPVTYELSYTLGGRVGYYNDAFAGADFRLGLLASPFYLHQPKPLGNMSLLVDAEPEFERDAFLFLSYRARVVAYNALLQGQFLNSEVTISSSDIERLIHEASIGMTARCCKTFSFSYAMHFRSEEFSGGMDSSHWWHGLYLSWDI